MRHWGIVITLFYAVVVTFLFMPGISLVGGEESLAWPWSVDLLVIVIFGSWLLLLIFSQAILVFVSVDTAWRRIKTRQHVLVSVAAVALAIALLSFAGLISVSAGIWGDDVFWPESELGTFWAMWLPVIIFWIIWGFVFHHYRQGEADQLNRFIGWLIKGSVLELLIAVPCHVVVRYREDCSAPGLTGFGIATGIAVMLLAFGPSVIFLYQKRMSRYNRLEDL